MLHLWVHRGTLGPLRRRSCHPTSCHPPSHSMLLSHRGVPGKPCCQRAFLPGFSSPCACRRIRGGLIQGLGLDAGGRKGSAVSCESTVLQGAAARAAKPNKTRLTSFFFFFFFLNSSGFYCKGQNHDGKRDIITELGPEHRTHPGAPWVSSPPWSSTQSQL